MNTHVIKPTDKAESQKLRWLQVACKNKKEYRHNNALKGIRIEENNAVATDGCRLHMIKTPEFLKDYLNKTLIPENKVTVTPKPQEFTESNDLYPAWSEIVGLVEDQIKNGGVKFKIGLNKKYLADLKDMPGDDLVILTFTGEEEPVKISKPDNEAVAIIMPMRI